LIGHSISQLPHSVADPLIEYSGNQSLNQLATALSIAPIKQLSKIYLFIPFEIGA
jgi:hypothetical protein